MTFAELEQKVGKVLAILIAWERVPAEVLANLKLAECISIYLQSDDPVISQKMAEKALALAATVDECLDIFDHVYMTGILEKAFNLAKTIEDYLKVYDYLDVDNPLRTQVFKRIQDLVITVEDALLVFKHTHLSPEIKSFEKALALVKTFADAAHVHHSAFPGSEQKEAALVKMLEMAQTTDDCLEVHKKSRGAEQMALALDKALQLASSFADIFKVYKHSPRFSDQKNQAFSKALEIASTSRECLDLKIQSSEDSERELALAKAIELANSIEGHLAVHYYAGGDESKISLDKALSLANTYEDCLVIYNSGDGGEPPKRALEKMKQIWQQSQ